MAETVISEIRAWMARRGVNQTQLAEALGFSQSQMSKRLRHTIPIAVDELEDIADYLDVDPVVFMKPSVTPWPDGPGEGPGGGGRSRAGDLERLADRKRRHAPDGPNHRYAA